MGGDGRLPRPEEVAAARANVGMGLLQLNAADYTVVTASPLAFTGTAGETRTITVNVNGDTTVEANEDFAVTLSGAVNGTIGTAAAANLIVGRCTSA